MIVVLDTTAICSDPLCSGTAWRVLAHASRSWGLRIFIPEVVLAEAIGGYEREISHASASLDKTIDKFSGRLGLSKATNEAKKGFAKAAEEYPRRIREIASEIGAEILPPPESSHMELVTRATSRRKPCDSKGDGYRDTLNWLTILSLATEYPDDHIYWVSNNTEDFANDSKDDFHADLMADLSQVHADDRVHLALELTSLLLTLAAGHYEDSADDLKKVRDQLQESSLVNFVNETILPVVAGRELSPRQCGLPLSTATAKILAVQQVKKLQAEVRGTIGEGGAFAEFQFTAESLIGVDLENEDVLLGDDFETAEGVDIDASTLKDLKFSGLIQLDKYGRPVNGEVAKVNALEGDPGLKQWKRHTSSNLSGGLAALQNAIKNLQRPATDLNLIARLSRPAVDPKLMARLYRPAIDPSLLARLSRPAISPDLLARLYRPPFSPRIFGLQASNYLSGEDDEMVSDSNDDIESVNEDDEEE